MRFCPPRLRSVVAAAVLLSFLAVHAAAEAPEHLTINQGDRVLLIGNTLAERMLYHGHFETLLYSRFAEHELFVRNLGWSADELKIRLRTASFHDHGHELHDYKPNVILAFFGFNE